MGSLPELLWDTHGALRVSSDGHHIEHADGKAFFWLGDTAWKLIRLAPKDLDRYLAHRAGRGFNVIQINITGWQDTNYAGEMPFVGDGPPWPEPALNERYWAHLDRIIERAAGHGLYIAAFVWWGRSADTTFSDPLVHNHAYGRLLGERYADAPNLIWVVAGEYHTPNMWTPPVSPEHLANVEAVAKGLKAADPNHLMSIHPLSFLSSSHHFHKAEWLDFNMVQSHVFAHTIEPLIAEDWAREPAKPTLSAEPWYEGEEGLYERKAKVSRLAGYDYDMAWIQRYQAYWAMFAGSFGTVYGHMNLWTMNPTEAYWLEDAASMRVVPGTLLDSALEAPGSLHLCHVRRLAESRPAQERVPAPELLTADTRGHRGTLSPNLRCATRANDSRYAWLYSTRGEILGVHMSQLAPGTMSISWYDPRTGASQAAPTRPIPSGPGAADAYFVPPGEPADGNDWVLVLIRDDA